jgi:hypothetical protein
MSRIILVTEGLNPIGYPVLSGCLDTTGIAKVDVSSSSWLRDMTLSGLVNLLLDSPGDRGRELVRSVDESSSLDTARYTRILESSTASL